VEWRELTHVALTHFHTDHWGDLAPLLFALTHGIRPRREAPLTLLGPPGLEARLEWLARAFGDHVRDPGFALRVVELGRHDAWADEGAGLRIRTHPTRHTEHSVAYRVRTAAVGAGKESGPSVGYTGDTGPLPALGAFFRGVDLLIAECSLADPPEITTHLSPEGVATLCRNARPGRVVLTHLYPELDPGRVPGEVAAAGYGGRVQVAADGDLFPVGGPGP
jgi:ribonuclease BN (tRNA processing enzyme)